MYNFLSKHRYLISIIFLLFIVFIIAEFYIFAFEIFKETSIYFYTLSTIVQSFVALVAFLGTMVVFKVQLEDQAMQKLAEGIESVVMHYCGQIAKTSTPTQISNILKEILETKENTMHRDLIEKVSSKMEETLKSRNATRNKMVNFALITFLNVGIALIMLPFTPIFISNYYLGGLLLIVNILFSIYILNKALEVVRSTMGYGFSIKL